MARDHHRQRSLTLLTRQMQLGHHPATGSPETVVGRLHVDPLRRFDMLFAKGDRVAMWEQFGWPIEECLTQDTAVAS